MRRRRQQGFTLIELVISMVVVAVGLTGILTVMNRTVQSSSDPMVLEQEIAIAEAYMDEILSKKFTHLVEAGENRQTWDDVADYNNLAEAPTDQDGNSPAELADYRVTVATTDGITTGQTMTEITVTVTHTHSDIRYVLVGYRGWW